MIKLRSLLATAFVALIGVAIALDVAHRDFLGEDFHTYLAAAMVGLQQGWSHIYDEGPVAAAQHLLNPHLWVQPFLSTPPVAWLVSPLASLPYNVAYGIWSVVTFGALAASLAWSSGYRGIARWVATAAAIVPWWVLHAVHVGQVAPLIAASVLVAWRLLRDKRDVAAGLVLVTLAFKPNTVALIPIALVVAGRWKAFATWLAATALVAVASLLAIGPHGMAAYASDLTHVTSAELRGASQLTLATVLGLSPPVSAIVRALIALAALVAVYRYRREPGMAIATAAVASLLTTSYLHGSDLCLLGAAGWIAWHEREDPAWRALLAGVWVLATPFLDGSAFAPALNRWVFCELVVLGAFVVDAWVPRPLITAHGLSLTGWAAPRRQAPA